MSTEKERPHRATGIGTRALANATITLAMAIASVPANGDQLKVLQGNGQNVAVPEGSGGTLTWIINNQGPGNITLDNGFGNAGIMFLYTGDDKDDSPLPGNIGGCNNGVKLLGNGGQCVLTIDFTSPAVKDTTDDENSDRGFWDLSTAKGDSFPVLTGTLDSGAKVTSDFLVGHVEIDDPGVKPATTPEPPAALLSLTGLLFGLLAFALKQGGRVPIHRGLIAMGGVHSRPTLPPR